MYFAEFLGSGKRPRKKRVENVKFELSCRRHADCKISRKYEILSKIEQKYIKNDSKLVVENDNPKKGSKKGVRVTRVTGCGSL